MFRDVTLPEVLVSREQRRARRDELRQTGGKTVIQITVNTPGPRKNSTMIQEIFNTGVGSLEELFAPQITAVRQAPDEVTGPSAWIALEGETERIKRSCCGLEESHPWGRLWDLDVYDERDRALSREELGFEGRRCLICGRPAHECGRSRAHSIEQLRKKIISIHGESKNVIPK